MTTIFIRNDKSLAAKLFLAVAKLLWNKQNLTIESTNAESIRDIDAEVKRGIEYNRQRRAGLVKGTNWTEFLEELRFNIDIY